MLNAQLGASMVVLCVTCDRALRYARLTERSERPLTVEEAIERDFREIDHLEKGGPIAIADYTLLNNGATGSAPCFVRRVNWRVRGGTLNQLNCVR
ncbi:MAG UNVERIFIED_CONTAM: hypothetical protein LVT10_16525 [Anaerolineae bacterium]